MSKSRSKSFKKSSGQVYQHRLIGESLGSRIHYDRSDALGNRCAFYIWPISSPTLGKSDRVLLDIYTQTEPNVLIGGNKLNVDVLEGIGKLTVVNFLDGEIVERQLEPGMKVDIPAENVAYWYENQGRNNLLLRDTCTDFDPINEPLLEDVVRTLASLYSYTEPTK